MNRHSELHNENNFDTVLSNAIDNALTGLGEPVKKILFYHIQNKFLMKPEDIPKNPDLFVLALKNLLGAGSSHVETLILEEVCRTYKLDSACFLNKRFDEAIEIIRKEIGET